MSFRKFFASALVAISVVAAVGFASMPANAAPASPVVSGTTAVGSTLTVNPGQWDVSPAPTEQWFRNGLAIRGATSATYTLTAADYLQEITVVVKGNRSTKPAVEFAQLLPLIAAGPDTPAATGTTVAQLAPSKGGTYCGLLPAGTVQCMVSSRSELALHSPTTIAGITNAVAIAGSDNYNCALILDGTVTCWGTSFIGGPKGNFNPSGKALKIAGLTNVRAISISTTVCALIKDGSEKCFGQDDRSELGSVKPDVWNGPTGPIKYKNTPQVIAGLSNAIQISSGFLHNCALISTGVTKCWGDNHVARLGFATSSAAVKTPVAVTGLGETLQIVATENGGCAVLVAGGLTCWGDDSIERRSIPLFGNALVNQFESLTGSSCALMSDATEQCWGENGGGQLDGMIDQGEEVDQGNRPPFTLTLPEGVLQLASSTGQYTRCAILLSGTGYCWGEVDGTPTSWPGSFWSATYHTPIPVDLFGRVNPAPSPVVTIAGNPVEGSILTATVPSLGQTTSVSYNWYIDGMVVKSTDLTPSLTTPQALTYTMPAPDNYHVGSKIQFQVVIRSSDYRVVIANSLILTVKRGPVPISATPTITASTDAVRVGTKLTAVPGVWTAYATFKYVWKRDGVAIAKATKSTYDIVAADAGHAITVTATGSANYDYDGSPYISVQKTSDPVSVTR